MANLITEKVTSVHHWNDTLFSFRTTRQPGFRFENGHFTMIGLEHENRPLLRAYSIASANHEDELEFFSIKVQDGPLTSKLQQVKPGDDIFVSLKPTGTLIADNLKPGRNLYLVGTGTGLAPFISIIKDPAVYERFENIVVVHGTRYNSELAYRQLITEELPDDEFLGELATAQLRYYPAVTREPSLFAGRVTDLLSSGKLFADLGLPQADKEHDRFMLCGSPQMLKDTAAILDSWGLTESLRGYQAEYVIERAFVDK